MSGESQLCIKAGLPSTSASGARWAESGPTSVRSSYSLPSLLCPCPLPLRVEAARAAFPGQNGKLVFSFAGGVWVANADGSNAMQLTASNDRSPSWSPDGTKIAFASRRDGDDEIFVMNADAATSAKSPSTRRGPYKCLDRGRQADRLRQGVLRDLRRQRR